MFRPPEDWPEIRHLPFHRRRELVRGMQRRLWRDRWYWSRAIPFLVVILLPVAASMPGVTAQIPPRARVVLPLVSVLAILVFVLRVVHPAHRRAMQAELLHRGLRPTRCFRCDYDLRGTEGPRCTECGERLVSE